MSLYSPLSLFNETQDQCLVGATGYALNITTGREEVHVNSDYDSERGINDNNKGDAAGVAGHDNQCPGRERLFHRGDGPSAVPGPCRRSNGGVVAIGDVRRGAENSSGFVRIGGD